MNDSTYLGEQPEIKIRELKRDERFYVAPARYCDTFMSWTTILIFFPHFIDLRMKP
jgi:hypothetical protein